MNLQKHEVKSLWEQKLGDVFTDRKKEDMDIFLSILSIIMLEKFDENISKMYSTVNDINMFTTLINTFSGLTIKIPEREEFKNAVTVALSYYYKEVKKMKWSEIEKELPYEDNVSLKAGKGVAKLSKTIKESLNALFMQEET